MLARLAAAESLEETLQTGLRDVIALHGAEMGNVQMLAADGDLLIVAARGLSRAFLETFERVRLDSGSVCGRVLRSGKPLFVQDVALDADFAPYSAFAASVPFRSVLSCPLVRRGGELIGVISAHSANLFAPSRLELSTAETYAGHLADAIARRVPSPRERAAVAERLSRGLLEPA